MRLFYYLLICCLFTFSAAKAQLIRIGSGSVSGVYYPVAGQLSVLFNQQVTTDETVIFTPKLSDGSIQNIDELSQGIIDLAVAQSNYAKQFYKQGVANNQPAKQLRAMFSLYPESFTIIARKSANVYKFQDLKGKRVNVGELASGSQKDVQRILEVLGLNEKIFFKQIFHYSSNDAIEALCDNKIDAVIMTVGHPSSNFFRMVGKCRGRLISLSQKEINIITKAIPTFQPTSIPAGTYQGQAKTNTVGLYAMLLTRENQPADLVYRLTKKIFENLDILKNSHHVLNHLEAKVMAGQTFDVPLHPGALKYYQEVGLIPKD